MARFGVKTESGQRAVSRLIVKKTRELEAHFRALREEEGKTVMGRKHLMNQEIGAPYTREVEGCRMYVHSEDKDLRKATIKWIKELIEQGREVLERWREGDLSVPYPMGLFPPTGIRLIEPIGW